MKVAIPTIGTRVDEHFGHARTFTILTLDDSGRIVENETFLPPSGCGCKSTVGVTMQAKGVAVMLVGNIGQGAINKMAEHGIKVIRGCEGEILDVLKSWTDGDIEDKNILCNHEGCTH
ncbi:Predicted Fe-Mo cluster-binding protein, NifX family [Desulfomicrobium apsheronum]|uniref:Predicted Fe-Mo cluster-binding protein, NifX family n=1 Tax=Desulfomicrobium apsheronum TaxID=52560 RepID=A0A1I3YMH1_9BACT|nr:NifB/NifX family molybdenum-iron cluster-binding protein [Desulfomicrobium apsheronum]SFK33032.1 Predicted Fe-Mo cluster-binding protein, NifX family [Desulfomicrobium apsheronum]